MCEKSPESAKIFSVHVLHTVAGRYYWNEAEFFWQLFQFLSQPSSSGNETPPSYNNLQNGSFGNGAHR